MKKYIFSVKDMQNTGDNFFEQAECVNFFINIAHDNQCIYENI